MTFAVRTDPNSGAQSIVQVEQGVPSDYVNRGATTVAQYQQMAASDLSDKQIAAQKEIAQQQADLNQRQFDAQQAQIEQQQRQTEEQATRQSAYDTGRSATLADATRRIDEAFGSFTPEYYGKYAQDYMSQVNDQIDFQKKEAQRQLAFSLARQGIPLSQAGATQRGLIEETAGRNVADQTRNAQQAAADLKSRTASAKANLLAQATSAATTGSPIAGGTIEDVNSALDTSKAAVTPITSSAGDVVASLQAVPTVSPIGTIFGGVLGAGGAALSGAQAGSSLAAFNRGFAGTSPTATSVRFG